MALVNGKFFFSDPGFNNFENAQAVCATLGLDMASILTVDDYNNAAGYARETIDQHYRHAPKV